MAIGRSLTKKGSKYLDRVAGGHSHSVDESSNKRASLRTQISAPVALISTTNMISYTSPSLRSSQSHGSISDSSSLGSDSSPISPTSPHSSGDESADDAITPNHLSSYFSATPSMPSPVRSHSTKSSKSGISLSTRYARSPSMPPPPTTSTAAVGGRKSAWPQPQTQSMKQLHSLSRSNTQRSSVHPFGAELAKVAEMAEEIISGKAGGAGMDPDESEEEYMLSHGLQKFSAVDYEAEIMGLGGGVFEGQLPRLQAGWI